MERLAGLNAYVKDLIFYRPLSFIVPRQEKIGKMLQRKCLLADQAVKETESLCSIVRPGSGLDLRVCFLKSRGGVISTAS